MSHLPQALQNMVENDPSIRMIKKIPIGTMVRYHGRNGAMRQGRTEFPAMVLKQHPDDGSIDLIVFFEAEDMIWEQRITPYHEQTNPNHSWEPVGKPDEVDPRIDEIRAQIAALERTMYGEYNRPAKSLIEIFDIYDKRLKAVEAKLRK